MTEKMNAFRCPACPYHSKVTFSRKDFKVTLSQNEHKKKLVQTVDQMWIL